MKRSTRALVAIGCALTLSSLTNTPIPPARAILTAVIFGACVWAVIGGLSRGE